MWTPDIREQHTLIVTRCQNDLTGAEWRAKRNGSDSLDSLDSLAQLQGLEEFLRRLHRPRALFPKHAALQGKRLVTEQHPNHHFTRIAGIDRVLCN